MKQSEGAHDQTGTSHPSSEGSQSLLFIAAPALHSACIQQVLNYFLYCPNEEVEAQSRPVEDQYQNPAGSSCLPVEPLELWGSDRQPL